jgi:hypothetical protein
LRVVISGNAPSCSMRNSVIFARDNYHSVHVSNAHFAAVRLISDAHFLLSIGGTGIRPFCANSSRFHFVFVLEDFDVVHGELLRMNETVLAFWIVRVYQSQ